jgi:outer membrane protein assembly factor BamA
MTYGLGGHSSVSAAEQLDYRYLLYREAVLKSIFTDVYAGMGYDLDYHWDITDGGLPGGGISDFQRYGKTSKSISSGCTINLLYDSRQNPINPPKGYYASIVYRNNSTSLGSDENWQSMIFDLRSYYKLLADSRNVLAFWSYDWFILRGTPPYLDLPASSWDTYANQGRGYIQSRFRGRNLISLESEYRFGLTHDGLFGGVVFANAQSISDWPNIKFTVLHPGVGCGVRIKMNKHDDTNVAIDYGFGLQGSQGVFVNLGEVF